MLAPSSSTYVSPRSSSVLGDASHSASRMFRALFQYLPLRDSPNDNPGLELSLQPGDLIIVRGQMDDDGFYRGETVDGQTGLVPSNYVERVSDAWLSTAFPSTSSGEGGGGGLLDVAPSSSLPRRSRTESGDRRSFHRADSFVQPRTDSPSFQLNVPAHLSAIQHDFTSDLPAGLGPPPLPDSVCPYPPPDISRVTVTEIKETDTPRVPWPRDLVIEKRLSRSVVLSWSPPDEVYVAISQYHVCVDGQVRAVVPGNYKCRALIEEVSLDGAGVNVSVRAVTEHGHSPDAACTMAVGVDAAIAAQHLRVFNVTPISACIRWYPSNSNSDHVVSLNSQKIGVCPPSVFQVQVQGLAPSTIYRLSVRTKHPKAVLEQRPVERCIDFKTLPKIGLPDPPSSVAVESGPQPGTLLVSWIPVTNQPKSPSRAAIHSYLIYADGKNIAQVLTATADHVLLRLADLSDDPPIFITVRTRTKEGSVSSDSNSARVPRGGEQSGGYIGGRNPVVGILPGTGVASALSPLITNQATALQGGLLAQLQPVHQPLQTLTNLQTGLIQGGPLSDPSLLLKEGGGAMASSYPSALYHTNTYASPVAPYGTLPSGSHYRAPLAGPSPLLMSSTVAGVQAQPPYSAPVLPPSALPSYSTQTGLVQSYGGVIPVAAPTTYGEMMGGGGGGGAAGTAIQQWKQSSMPSTAAGPVGQYYTFHPRQLLRADASGRTVEERPSVLEMENNYVLRHRQAEWGTRVDAYARQNRAMSSEGVPVVGGATVAPGGTLLRQQPRLVPPRLARVKSETGFGTRSEPDLRPPILDDGDCRLFVALFDYSHHMSPNPNAEAEELSFRKHQLIKVYGDVDPDGFFHGTIGSRSGLVPSNMVIEIAKDDLLPRRQPVVSGAIIQPIEGPSLRRARWGSLKSRSYDHAGDRRYHHRRGDPEYTSLDRREGREPREHRDRERYRRSNGSRDYEERRREEPYYERERERDRDREYRQGSAREQPYRGEYEDEYRRGGSDYERERERRGHHEYREEYDRERREPRPYDRERDYHESRSRYESGGGGPSTGPPPTTSAPSTSTAPAPQPSNHVHGGVSHSNHLVQPGGHFPSAPPPLAPPPSQYTGNGHVMTGAGTMAHLQQGMASMSVGQPSQAGGMGYGATPPQGSVPSQVPAQPASTAAMMQMGLMDERLNGMQPKRVMVAKFDYDSRQLSPNVDAEQVELSFRQGDAITIYGEMDEDGFYIGELNGMRGLVPSNFLQSSPLSHLAPSQPMEPMRKAVGFNDPSAALRKAAPARQTSQSSGGGPSGGPPKPAAKKTSVAQPGGAKPLAKKTSDVGKSAPNARKTSTAVKKGEPPKV